MHYATKTLAVTQFQRVCKVFMKKDGWVFKIHSNRNELRHYYLVELHA
jgi:hypothetical protein